MSWCTTARPSTPITEFIPWTNLAWTQVHHGQLPLWNPYTVLGTPLTFDWQAGTFSLPALVGYLFPLSLAYTVQIVVTMVVAGTGAYVFGRVLRHGRPGVCAGRCRLRVERALRRLAGVADLVGHVVGGLVVRRRGAPAALRRGPARAVALFVGGAGRRGLLPDSPTPSSCWAPPSSCSSPPCWSGAPDVADVGADPAARVGASCGGVVGGAGLSAPLLLPGLQLFPQSMRAGKSLSQAVPLQSAVLVLFQGFDGSPVAGSHWFGSGYYTKTAVYVGVIAVVLAARGCRGGAQAPGRVRGRRGHTAVALAMAVIVYVPVVESLLDGVPLVGSAQWRRSTTAMAFALAVLAGLGADVPSCGRTTGASCGRGCAGLFSVAAAVLLRHVALRPGPAPPRRGHRPRPQLHLACRLRRARDRGGAVLILAARRRKVPAHAVQGHRHAGTRRAGARWSRGVVGGGGVGRGRDRLPGRSRRAAVSSSPTYLAPTAAEATLARAVGSSLVGLRAQHVLQHDSWASSPTTTWPSAVQEFAVYDPLVAPVLRELVAQTATGGLAAPVQTPIVPFSVFCPAVTTSAEARLYGIGFVLEAEGRPRPQRQRLRPARRRRGPLPDPRVRPRHRCPRSAPPGRRRGPTPPARRCR